MSNASACLQLVLGLCAIVVVFTPGRRAGGFGWPVALELVGGRVGQWPADPAPGLTLRRKAVSWTQRAGR
jgi:hypothetical protein